MTSETLQPKKPDLSLGEITMQNRESYDYLRSLVSENESPLKIDEWTFLSFLKGGDLNRGRSDKVRVTFQNQSSQVETEVYLVCDSGLIEFAMNSEPFLLSSGLQVQMHEYQENDDGHRLLREVDKGSRTAAKVIADGVRLRLRLSGER